MAGSEMAAPKVKMIVCYDGLLPHEWYFFFLQRLRSANLTRYLYAAQAATLIKAQYET